jgi:hypothetical protein
MSDFLFVQMSSATGAISQAQLIIGTNNDIIFKSSTVSDKANHIIMGYLRTPNKYRVSHVFSGNDWYSEIDVTNNIPASLAIWDRDIIVATHIELGGFYYISLNTYDIGLGTRTTSSSAFLLDSG